MLELSSVGGDGFQTQLSWVLEFSLYVRQKCEVTYGPGHGLEDTQPREVRVVRKERYRLRKKTHGDLD